MPEFALVVGESLVDIVHSADGRVTEHPGGSPANVAVALKRLERRTLLATSFANDRLGRLLSSHLRDAGVEVVLTDDPAGRTSSAIATLDSNGSAEYTFDLVWNLAHPEVRAVPLVVHTGSLGAVLLPGAQTVATLLARSRENSTITYDLNMRPQAMSSARGVRRQVESIVGRSDIVKASDEDLLWLYPELTCEQAAHHLRRLGPPAVVVTRGAEGAFCLSDQGRVDVRGLPVDVADTIGAGDTFCAALIDALWDRRLLGAARRDQLRTLPGPVWSEIVSHAILAATISVSRPGADPPRRGELASAGASFTTGGREVRTMVLTDRGH